MGAGRCTGHCCECFFLPGSPEELRASYEAWARQDGTAKVIEEIWLIYPMVRHLGAFARSPAPVHDQAAHDPPAHYYSCKHFDSATRNCTIYENRPKMCSGYPYGHACRYTECTWEEHASRAARLRVLS